MTTHFFPAVQTWQISEAAFEDSLKEMALDGADGNEGIMLWLGHRRDGQAEITHLVALRGSGIIKEPDFLQVEPSLLNDVTDLAIELGVSLVGQIHSHGPGYPTDLSLTDRRYGIIVPYYLSVVAPDYGMRYETRIFDCGVHIYEPNLGYCRLSQSEVAQRIQVIDSPRLPLFTIG